MQQRFWALHWLSCPDSLAHEKEWGIWMLLSFEKSLRQKRRRRREGIIDFLTSFG
jgi:hypothetical protein